MQSLNGSSGSFKLKEERWIHWCDFLYFWNLSSSERHGGGWNHAFPYFVYHMCLYHLAARKPPIHSHYQQNTECYQRPFETSNFGLWSREDSSSGKNRDIPRVQSSLRFTQDQLCWLVRPVKPKSNVLIHASMRSSSHRFKTDMYIFLSFVSYAELKYISLTPWY